MFSKELIKIRLTFNRYGNLALKINCVCIIMAFTLIAVSQGYAFAEKQIEVKSYFFEKTITIEFLNSGGESIKFFDFWLGNNSSFVSLRAESGWTGKITPYGVLVFTSDEPLRKDQSVKFEIKTDSTRTGINWKAIGGDGKQIQIGKETLKVPDTKPVKPEIKPSETGITPSSSFKIIPKNLRVDSKIRVIGESFGPDHTVDFFLNDEKLYSVKADKNGYFIFTSKIPHDTVVAGKVYFVVKDFQGNEIRQERFLKKPPTPDQDLKVKFKMDDFPSQIARGEKITISGTAPTSKQIISKIIGPSNSIWSEKSTVSDANGRWSFSFLTSNEFGLGQYSVTTSNLTDTISKNFQIVLAKQLKIDRLKPMFELHEPIIFNGTVLPNLNLKAYLIDTKGNEVSFIETNVSENGLVKIEYPTDSTTPLGTYFLFLFTEQESDVISVGVGKYPKNILSSKMDKTNYQIGDTAMITIIGTPSETVDLTIINSADRVKSKDMIKLGADGKIVHRIKIKDFFSDSYFVIVSKGNHRTSNNFTVGFKSGTTWLDHSFTKSSFTKGDLISFFGKTDPNISLEILLIEPHGNIVTKREFFSNNRGEFLIDNFRIPEDSSDGVWTLQTKSGLYSKNIHFQVKSKTNLFSINISDIQTSSAGVFIIMEGMNASPQQVVKIMIKSNETEKIWNLTVTPEKDGKFSVLWILPEDAGNGSYLVTAQDGTSRISQQTFKIYKN